MLKDKWKMFRRILISNCKIIFPVLIVVLGAITVVTALNAKNAEPQASVDGQAGISGSSDPSAATEEEARLSAAEVPLVPNENDNIYKLVTDYYNAIGGGEADAIRRMCPDISENNLLYYGEMANYIVSYSDLAVYSKQGPVDGTVIVYVEYTMEIKDYGGCPGYEALFVCTAEDGSLYIKDSSAFTEEEKAYIVTANEQVDVAELNNRVNAKYNELVEQNPKLLEYIGVLSEQLNTKVGEILASRIQSAQEQQGQEGTASESGSREQPAAEQPEAAGPKYANTTDTVNVRSSDSEKADKIGKVTKGAKIEVLEVRVNGWTKVSYEGKEGYIKSDYLRYEESAAALEVIGSITANTAVRIRAAADETAEKLGVLATGSTLELLGNENGWCKVNYNGQVAYVKAELVTQQ